MVEDTIHARYAWLRDDLVASLMRIFPEGDFRILVGPFS